MFLLSVTILLKNEALSVDKNEIVGRRRLAGCVAGSTGRDKSGGEMTDHHGVKPVLPVGARRQRCQLDPLIGKDGTGL